MIKDTKFYDTSSLLLAGETLFEQEDKFMISSVSLNELEYIKTSANKDDDVKYTARILLHLFKLHSDHYTVVIHKIDNEKAIAEKGLAITADTKILSDAVWADKHYFQDEITFVTNDLALESLANLFFGDGMIESVPEEKDTYTGYKEVYADEKLLNDFYQDISYNWFNLYINEYLILRSLDGELLDIRKWTGETHTFLDYSDFNSNYFGKIKPYNNDVYQKLLFDSLTNNQITMIKGPAGSGKTFIALGYLMMLLEKHKIDKIIVFCNTVATINSAKLGYYPGDRDSKLLDSQIGNLLSAKFGGKSEVERMIAENKLLLLPLSDVRGYDTSGMNAGVYISEAQNLDRTLMKLALQRIGEDCICIIDGDIKGQVDLPQYSGENNGMRKASKVFRGSEIYGEVTLKNIYRSKIGNLAEKI
jgi:predicted ribonuclease YlaK